MSLPSSFVKWVPEAGLEPARAQCPRDFKSLVSTIPPFRHGFLSKSEKLKTKSV